MGVKALPRIAGRLTAEGRDPAEPAAAIERGTLPGQRTVTGPLAEIAELAADAGVRPPAITVVGPVAARRETIAWLERRPLNAIRVIVTDEVRRAIEDIHAYALICLTSANSVRLLFEAMAGAGRDARALANASVAAIGPGTAAALAEFGVMADLLPERMVAESLVEALEEIDLKGKRVLLARASEAREVLPDALRRLGAELDVSRCTRRSPRRPHPRRLNVLRAPATSPSPPPRPSATWWTRWARSCRDRPGSSRSGRSPARRSVRRDWRWPSRPSATTLT